MLQQSSVNSNIGLRAVARPANPRPAIPTIAIVDESMPLGFVTINQADFDETIHVAYDGKASAKTSRRNRGTSSEQVAPSEQ